MGKSKRHKAPRNDVSFLPTGASQRQQQQQLPKAPAKPDTIGSTPGRVEVGSPRAQQLMGKVHLRATENSVSAHHLPTITRGPQGLRQMHHHGSSPLQRTPGNHAATAKIEYLSQIATWAASNKIPSLGAFYGERLASACQSAGIPSPVLKSQCERCESVLVPAVNYSVISGSKKTKKKRKGNAGEALATVNTVVHRCHYCNYANQKVRSLKDDVKTKLAEAASRAQMNDVTSSTSSRSPATADSTTPVHTQGLMKSVEGSHYIPVTMVASKPAVLSPASVLQVDQSASSSIKKRKRKGWTGLKAISTALPNGEVPTPERLGFAVDFTSPLNPRKRGSI